MTPETEEFLRLVREVSSPLVAGWKDELLDAKTGIERRNYILSELARLHLTEPCTLKSTLRDLALSGEVVFYNDAYVFFPDGTGYDGFRLGTKVIAFDDQPSQPEK